MSDFWDEKFKESEYLYGTHPNAFLTSVVGILKNNSKVLMLGEGEGRNAVYLAKLGHQVTALDSSQRGKEKTLELAAKEKVSIDYQLTLLQDYNYPEEKFEAAVFIFCHLPPDIRSSVHQKVYKSLKPGGIILMQAYTPQQLEYKTGGPGSIEMLYTPELIRDDFSGTQELRLEESLEFLSEGKGHHGDSAVMNVVLSKPSDH